jgi:hypothetical protein
MYTRFTCLLLLLCLLLAAGTARADLVSQWLLDEGAGTTAADSGPGGNDGTFFGNLTWVPGVSGTAVEFHGTGAAGSPTEYINCGSDASLDITSKISITMWIKPGADDPEGNTMETAPMAKADSAASPSWSWQVRYGWGSTKPFMAFTFNTSPRAWAYVNQNLTRDEWCHIACSHDGTTLKCYLNGEETDSTSMGAITISPAPVLIGSDGWGSDWIGAIDDVRIYNHGLSQDEILATMSTEPVPTASGPTPKNGSMIDKKSPTLTWRAGDFAALHDVYFGEDPNKVAAATQADTDVFVGRQAGTSLEVGSSDAPYPDGLVPGKVYYWRVDEINDTNPDSPWKGTVWQFQVQPLIAWQPWPPSGMINVDPNQDLTWQKGLETVFHIVYFGDDFDTVNNATGGTIWTVPGVYDPGTLELDKIYYWRVDEFAGVAATYKGDVWSFTTRDAGGGVKAAYFKGTALAGDPVLTRTEGTIDHDWLTGEVAGGLSDTVSARWTADLTVPFTETYKLITTTDDGVRLWLDGRPVIDDWADQSASDNSVSVNLIAGQIYAIRMEWYDNTSAAVAKLSWESPSLARQIIPQGWLQLPLWATGPSPANTEPYAAQDTLLQWLPGEEATDHDVYFGDDAAAVANADTSTTGIYQGRQSADKTTFDPGQLEWGKSYFWRIDEINTANAESPWKGSLWSFTAADFLIVDNFESYTDEEDVGARIYETWADGYSDGSSGSTVGYIDPPFAEQSIVHGGRQSMPLDYNNVNNPFYSEATREWSTAQNCTVNGVDSLTLYFRGKSNNGQEKLYVILADSTGNSAMVVHPDPAAAAVTRWTEWKIPLSSFTGVNAAKVKSLIIGLGDKNAPKQGGAGLLFIDDIRVTKP